MAVVSTPAIVLRAFPYGDTSRILRFLTLEMGVVGVVAKGVRKSGSKTGSGLETFAEGTLTFYHKGTRDLQTFKDFAPEKPRRGLPRQVLRFAGASLLCELVLKHAGEEAVPPLYRTLSEGLDGVEGGPKEDLPSVILAAGWHLVAVLGYRPVLDPCVRCGSSLGEKEMARFDFGAGGLRCARCSGEGDGPRVGPGARMQLRELIRGRPPDGLLLPGAHLRLLSDFVTYHVSGGRPLKSFQLLQSLLRGKEEEDDPER